MSCVIYIARSAVCTVVKVDSTWVVHTPDGRQEFDTPRGAWLYLSDIKRDGCPVPDEVLDSMSLECEAHDMDANRATPPFTNEDLFWLTIVAVAGFAFLLWLFS